MTHSSPATPPEGLESLARFYLRFGRFLRDAIGLALIAFALMSLLAIWGMTDGVLVAPFAGMLVRWFGWGCFIILFAIAYLGFSILRQRSGEVHWGRIFALELAAFLTLGLFSALSGNDLLMADAGMYGGRLGWGMVTLAWRYMGAILGTLVLFLLWMLTVVTGFGLWTKLEVWLLKFAGETPPDAAPNPMVESKPEVVETSPQVEKSTAATPKKKVQQIPPEFRTSFKSTPKKDEKPAKPLTRSEELPPLSILMTDAAARADDRTINQTAGLIMKTLADFGIPATVIGYRVGPSVTQFAVQPGFIKKPGSDEEDVQQMKVRVAQIAALEKDIALALSAQRLRIEAPVPGKPYVGIEVPNTHS